MWTLSSDIHSSFTQKRTAEADFIGNVRRSSFRCDHATARKSNDLAATLAVSRLDARFCEIRQAFRLVLAGAGLIGEPV